MVSKWKAGSEPGSGSKGLDTQHWPYHCSIFFLYFYFLWNLFKKPYSCNGGTEKCVTICRLLLIPYLCATHSSDTVPFNDRGIDPPPPPAAALTLVICLPPSCLRFRGLCSFFIISWYLHSGQKIQDVSEDPSGEVSFKTPGNKVNPKYPPHLTQWHTARHPLPPAAGKRSNN